MDCFNFSEARIDNSSLLLLALGETHADHPRLMYNILTLALANLYCVYQLMFRQRLLEKIPILQAE